MQGQLTDNHAKRCQNASECVESFEKVFFPGIGCSLGFSFSFVFWRSLALGHFPRASADLICHVFTHGCTEMGIWLRELFFGSQHLLCFYMFLCLEWLGGAISLYFYVVFYSLLVEQMFFTEFLHVVYSSGFKNHILRVHSTAFLHGLS